MTRTVKYSFTVACLLICLLTGCRSPAVVNAGTGEVYVIIIGGAELDGNTVDATAKLKAALK